MRSLLFSLSIAALALVWWHEKTTSTTLQAQVQALAANQQQPADLEAERLALQRRLPGESEEQSLFATAHEARLLKDKIASLATGKNGESSLSQSPLGEWSPVTRWQNRGTGSARDALETALWAAAGGDTARPSQLLEISDDVRAEANAVIARMPPSVRPEYPNAEALIATFTTKRIPVGAAQIVWSQQTDADHAALWVFVKDPAAPPPTAETIVPAHDESNPPEMTREQAIAEAIRRATERKRVDHIPPAISPNPQTMQAYLSLQRGDDGWRLVVPASAVEKIAKDLGQLPAP
jgi:hypothetical protein